MWEFMVEYANGFWAAGDKSLEIFRVLMAWTITAGAAIATAKIIIFIGECIIEAIEERIKNNG